jgi:photosystem II stability/assembly factor-like uncharacterized protein
MMVNKQLVRWVAVLVIAISQRFLLAQAVDAAALSAVTWVNVTGNLANMASQCGNLTMLSPVPGSDMVMAGVALDGLWANGSGSTWSQLGIGAGSDTITNRPSWIVYDPVNPGVFWESGIYNGGGVYKTTDNGNSFHQLGSIAQIDTISVDFGDPARQTLLAGGHEQSQTVWRSTNGGVDWANIGSTIPDATGFSSDPLIIDSQTYLVDGSAIYRTHDGGASWQQVSTFGASRPPLVAANGNIYWSSGNSLIRSTDSGVTWTQVGSGSIAAVRPIELPDGRLVSVGGSNLMISADNGSTWSPIGATLPYAPVGVIYSVAQGAFFIWTADCGSVVLPNAVMSLDYAISSSPSAPVGLRVVGQ